MKTSLNLFILLIIFSSIGCKKQVDDTPPPPGPSNANLVFKFKFDSTQVRLNNIGQPSVIPPGNAAQSPVFNTMSAHYVELAPSAFTALGAGAVLYKADQTSVAGQTAIDFEKAKITIALRHEISNNQKQYWCYDIALLNSFSKDSRDYADKQGQELLHACATTVNSHLTKFMFNTFLKLKGSKIPMKVFTKKAEAIKWLSEIKANNDKVNK